MFRVGKRLSLTRFLNNWSTIIKPFVFRRYSSTSELSKSKCRLVGSKLKSRSLVRVRGPETFPFLQGLITNDITHLESQPAIFTLWLNQGGRVLFDSIVYSQVKEEEVSVVIEADQALQPALLKHLKLYRVRRKVQIDDASKDLQPWVIFDPQHKRTIVQSQSPPTGNSSISESERLIDSELCCSSAVPGTHSSKRQELVLDSDIRGIGDPRLEELGWRVLLRPEEDLKAKDNLDIGGESEYRSLLYALGVGEGESDFPSANSFPLESNGDYLHGISFHKGCYIGQELTARTHHTGVVRKRLMPFRLPENFQLAPELDPASLQLLNPAGKSIGKVRSILGPYGLALTRIEEALSAPEIRLGDICVVSLQKPLWWPIEASKEIKGTRQK